MPFDRVDDRLGLELRDEHYRAAETHANVEHAGQPEHVERRQHGYADVVVVEPEQLARYRAVHEELEVVSSAPFGFPVVPLVWMITAVSSALAGSISPVSSAKYSSS